MENKFLIPGAIIVAGLLVGGALLFTGDGEQADTLPTDNNEITINPITNEDHILGSPNASITFVEYSDIDCPFCATFHETMNRIIDEYGPSGKVAWVFRHFPLSQIHPNAEAKARAAECVANLEGNNAFWRYLDELFAREDETRNDLATIASGIGVNQQEFENCLNDGDFEDKVSRDAADARRAGAQGTPHTIIVIEGTGELIPLSGAQPYNSVKEIIDTVLSDDVPAEAVQDQNSPAETGTTTQN